MNTNRFSSPRVSRYKPRPVEYLGMTLPLWIGTGTVAIAIVGIVYCLLTHRIPL